MKRHTWILFLLLICLLQPDAIAQSSRKRGGFQESPEATPKPAKKKSPTKPVQDDSPSTPKAKKKPAATATEDEEPKTPAKRKAAVESKTEDAKKPAEDQSEPAENGRTGKMQGPVVATLTTDSLAEFNQQPAWLQTLIRDALALTARNLGYLFGSADPQAGGMDCSGTIYYLLQKAGYRDVPRDSRGQYDWIESKGTLRVVDTADMPRFDGARLRPGDLLFWTGTYSVNRDLPISHVMLFLGTEKATGKPVMWGASDGRSYAGKQCYGVSVFDFKLPKAESKSKFVGFGQLPMPGRK